MMGTDFGQISPTLASSIADGSASTPGPVSGDPGECADVGLDDAEPTLLERGEMLLELFAMAQVEALS